MGNTYQRQDYNFIDEFPLVGISYYRLRSVDFDGYTEVFDNAMVEVEGTNKDFSIYPNPIENNRFSIQTNFDIDQAELLIYDNMGNQQTRITINDWLSEQELSALRPGNYLFKLVSSEGVMVKRVLVK